MTIDAYIQGGNDAYHDIRFHEATPAGIIYSRFAADAEENPGMSDALSSLTDFCEELSGIAGLMLRKLEWSRPDGQKEVLVKITAKAPTKHYETMKVELPKFGYRQVLDEAKNVVYVGWHCYEHTKDAIRQLEEALSGYVRHGSGQLELAFQQDLAKQVDQFVSAQ